MAARREKSRPKIASLMFSESSSLNPTGVFFRVCSAILPTKGSNYNGTMTKWLRHEIVNFVFSEYTGTNLVNVILLGNEFSLLEWGEYAPHISCIASVPTIWDATEKL